MLSLYNKKKKTICLHVTGVREQIQFTLVLGFTLYKRTQSHAYATLYRDYDIPVPIV